MIEQLDYMGFFFVFVFGDRLSKPQSERKEVERGFSCPAKLGVIFFFWLLVTSTVSFLPMYVQLITKQKAVRIIRIMQTAAVINRFYNIPLKLVSKVVFISWHVHLYLWDFSLLFWY